MFDALRHAEGCAIVKEGGDPCRTGFSREKVASDLLAVYRWIVGGGTPPACVRLQ
jgi:hypothetical protein